MLPTRANINDGACASFLLSLCCGRRNVGRIRHRAIGVLPRRNPRRARRQAVYFKAQFLRRVRTANDKGSRVRKLRGVDDLEYRGRRSNQHRNRRPSDQLPSGQRCPSPLNGPRSNRGNVQRRRARVRYRRHERKSLPHDIGRCRGSSRGDRVRAGYASQVGRGPYLHVVDIRPIGQGGAITEPRDLEAAERDICGEGLIPVLQDRRG